MKQVFLRIITYTLILAVCFLNSCKKNEDIDLSEFYIDPVALAGSEFKEWICTEMQADMYAYDPAAGEAVFDTRLHWGRDELKDAKFLFYRNGKLITTPGVYNLLNIPSETTWGISTENYIVHYIQMDKAEWKLLRHIAKTENHPNR